MKKKQSVKESYHSMHIHVPSNGLAALHLQTSEALPHNHSTNTAQARTLGSVFTYLAYEDG